MTAETITHPGVQSRQCVFRYAPVMLLKVPLGHGFWFGNFAAASHQYPGGQRRGRLVLTKQ